MNSSRTAPSPRRVVFFSPALSEGALNAFGSGLECVRPASAYEAAAELLAGPVEALVVDLHLLRPCHVRLIEIANQAGAKVLGVGSLPAWATHGQLEGLRPLGREQLVRALGLLAGRSEVQAPSTEGSKQAQPSATGGSAWDRKTGQGGTYETQKAAQPKAASGPEPLLTAEELSALLGDVK